MDCVLVTSSGRVMQVSPGSSVQEAPAEGDSHVLELEALVEEASDGGGQRSFLLPPFEEERESGSRSEVLHAQWLKRFPDVLVALVATTRSAKGL